MMQAGQDRVPAALEQQASTGLECEQPTKRAGGPLQPCEGSPGSGAEGAAGPHVPLGYDARQPAGAVLSLQQTSLATSQLDTYITVPSRLGRAESDPDRDDYLLKLLGKGSQPSRPATTTNTGLPSVSLTVTLPLAAPATAAAQAPAAMTGGFRAPDPRPAVKAAPPATAQPAAAAVRTSRAVHFPAAPTPPAAPGLAAQQTSQSRQGSGATPTGTAPAAAPIRPATAAGTAHAQHQPAQAPKNARHQHHRHHNSQHPRHNSPQHALAAAGASPGLAHLLARELLTSESGQQAAASSTGDLFAHTKRRLGEETTASVRGTIVQQQIQFVEQLYDMHRAMAVQKLLLQNCPEVQQVMGEARKLMDVVQSSQHGSGGDGSGGSRGRDAKRQRTSAKGLQSLSGPPTLRPDSQFAAVPQQPGDTTTCGGSGDGSGNGSGGEGGSGGGSTSPPRQAGATPLQHHWAAVLGPHPPTATPSGASASPMMAALGSSPPAGWRPPMPPAMQMPAGQLQAQAGPWGPVGPGGRMLAPPPGMLGPLPGFGPGEMMPGMMADPMAMWYQTYYGRPFGQGQQEQGQQGGMPAGNVQGATIASPLLPVGAGAAVAAAGRPSAGAPTAPKWWQDAQATFGPAVGDAALIAQRNAAVAAAERRGCEAESTPSAVADENEGDVPSPSHHQQRHSTYGMQATHRGSGSRRTGQQQRAPKRKAAPPPAADADEASSGTTGHDHRGCLGGGNASQDTAPHNGHASAPQRLPGRAARPAPLPAEGLPKATDAANVAELLLSMSNNGQSKHLQADA